MGVVEVFGVIAAIIVLGFLAELVFKKTGIPDVLVLIIVGIVIGTVLQWASPDSFGAGSELFATFALLFILFQGALNIDIKSLVATLSESLALTAMSFGITAAVTTLISLALGFPLLVAALIGMILGGTSGAVVIPLVRGLRMGERQGLALMLESAISDVLCIVGAVTVLQIFETGNALPSQIFKTILSSFSLAIIVGAALGVVWVVMMNKFTVLSNAYMVTIAVLVGVYAFVEGPFVQASGAIAALAFGLVMGNARPLLKLLRMKKRIDLPEAEKRLPEVRNIVDENAKNFYAEISFFVKVFFFVYLGILIDFSSPLVFLYGALLTLGIYFLRPISVRAVYWGKKIAAKDRALMEVLIPKGLAAAVLAQLAVQRGVPQSGELVNMVLSVVLLSIVLTSALAFLASKGWFPGLWDMLRKRTSAPES